MSGEPYRYPTHDSFSSPGSERSGFMDPLVSIVIPVYNMEAFVKKCVESIAAQSYSNWEIILVNDGSKDHSAAICRDIAEKHPHITLINQENSGVSIARNTGMQSAAGKYLLFLDADDLLPEYALAVLVEAAEQSNSDMVIGKIYADEKIPVGIFEGDTFLEKILEDNPIGYYSCRILYKREFVRDISFPKGFTCSEDSYFVFTCALKLPKVAVIDKQVYIYYKNPNSSTRSNFTEKKYTDICVLLEKKEDTIKAKYPRLLPLFYHSKVKIQMMLLDNLARTRGRWAREKEKETLNRFHESKAYFHADLPYARAPLYRILSANLFFLYKIFISLKMAAKRLLRR